MNILWVCNVPLPEASILLGKKIQPLGGWLVNLSKQISLQKDINLSIAYPDVSPGKGICLRGERINYYIFPFTRGRSQEETIKKILDQVQPDILHIWGTEYSHSNTATILFNNPKKTIVNIQGLVSIIAQHYYAGIPSNVISRTTIRDFLRRDNIAQQKEKFQKRGLVEIDTLKHVRHAIGRTTWDRACVTQINPGIQYHYCPEILRDAFYSTRWDLLSCERNSIFVSQGQYPIKGLHFAFEALPLIVKKFPKTMLFIAGSNLFEKEPIKLASYEKYLKELIRKNHMQEHVKYTGLLNEDEMCSRYRKTHVFLSPSAIENESNSLSEAKILGVPCVASYVGGVTDRIAHGEDGLLYPYDEPYMLSYYVCKLFSDDTLACTMSKSENTNAVRLHDREANTKRLLSIYSTVYSKLD